jgi:alpha-galactosidase/6-phospho-beta-glucosidase family protein
MSRKPKITIVGGGSPSWVKGLVKDMFLTPCLSEATYVLYDIDLNAAELTAAFLRKLSSQLKIGPTIEVSDRRESLAGSDYIAITISTGGFGSMAFDISIPEEHGIYHTVGDTSGPGGWARFIRNFKPFMDLVRTIRETAPAALVLNYTNPMTTLTDLLCRQLKNPVVGLCHGLFENLEFIKRHYDLKDESEISINYGGINHFFWCDRIRVRGRDVLGELQESSKSLSEILKVSYVDNAGHSSEREIASELFKLTGILPYLGDRHTCEFFSCYITDLATMEKYNLKRTSVASRIEQHEKLRKNLREMIAGEIEADYLKRSRETAADIIEAHHTQKAFVDVGNLPNQGQINNLPLGAIVETAMRVDQNGFTPICYGGLTQSVLPWVQSYTSVFKMTVDACLEGDRRKALQALRHDPVCGRLTTPKVLAMGNELLEAHRPWIDCF